MSENEKNELEQDRKDAEAKAIAENKVRTGVGTRLFVGATRGRNTSIISYENFDDSLPETLPKSLKEFVEVTKATEAELLSYAIVGYNDALYKAASDEIGEFINKAWDKDTIAQFRVVVRNLSKAMNKSIEDVVAMVKPGIEMAYQAKVASQQTQTAPVQ